MAASGAKYGIATAHFYWVGAIPAMVFLAVFMMPFYYGSKARSVPEYLKMRFDERVAPERDFLRGMTVFASGISMNALAKLLHLCWVGFHYASLLDFLRRGAGLCVQRRADLGHLHRSAAIFHDRAGLCPGGVPWPEGYGWMGRDKGIAGQRCSESRRA